MSQRDAYLAVLRDIVADGHVVCAGIPGSESAWKPTPQWLT